MQLNLTSLKYKEKASLDSGDIDWRRICKEDEQRKLYNKYLLELTSRNMTYNTFVKQLHAPVAKQPSPSNANVKAGIKQVSPSSSWRSKKRH